MTLLEFHIRYILLQDIHTYSISVAQWLAWQSSTAKIGVRFPVVKNIYKLGSSDAVNFFVSTDDEGDRRLNFTSLEFGVLATFWLNPWSVKEASHHPAFMGNRPTIIRTFLALSTQRMSSPLRKGGQPMISSCSLGVRCESRELGGEAGEFKTVNTNGRELFHRLSFSYRKLLDKVAFRILSNINDGAPL